MSELIVSADQICTAAETTLKNHLADTVEALGWTQRLGKIADWQQLPVTDAIATAKLPALAITTGGIVGAPVVTRDGIVTTWGLALGIYARGRTHVETQAHVRDWCAAVRLTLLNHKSLGGIARDTTWVGERFDLIPARDSARTFGAGLVSLDVECRMAPDSTNPTGGVLPTVRTTPTTVSVR